MKARSELTASELAELYEDLDRRLSKIGIETQPAVAASILDLTQDPDAGMQDFARIIRNDPALTGRIIRLSNSAFFAQRKPVTSVDRACVLLGMERVRSISLGFYLSRAAVGNDMGTQISREIWGQSVFRACLAAELARAVIPSSSPEAFVIGLMLDAGIPLAHRMLGAIFESLYIREYSPTKSFGIEFSQHPYTHVDVIATLVRRWKFPEILAKPILWHHAPPPAGPLTSDPLQTLYRIAYYVGAVALSHDARPVQRVPLAATADSHLGLSSETLAKLVDRAIHEYDAVQELFNDVAEPVTEAELAAHVHSELIGVLDTQMESSLADASNPGPQEFKLGGFTVMLRPEEPGQGMAFSYDSAGEPLSAYRFRFAEESVDSLRAALGLDPTDHDDIDGISEYLRRLAA